MDAPDVGHADVVVVHPLDVGDQVALEELHQEADLALGPAEVVLQREGVEREPWKVDARGGFDDILDTFGALLVAEEALESALAGPAAVAVHDDGYVLWDAHGVQRVIKRTLCGRELMGTVGALIHAAGRLISQGFLAEIDDRRRAGNRE